MTPRAAKPALHITVAAENPETVDGLLTYLNGAGVPTHGTCSIQDLSNAAQLTRAIVLFPDGFESAEALATIGELRRQHPRLLIVLVTREAERFKLAAMPDGRSILPLVLPRPAFGWTILDAVRAHAD